MLEGTAVTWKPRRIGKRNSKEAHSHIWQGCAGCGQSFSPSLHGTSLSVLMAWWLNSSREGEYFNRPGQKLQQLLPPNLGYYTLSPLSCCTGRSRASPDSVREDSAQEHEYLGNENNWRCFWRLSLFLVVKALIILLSFSPFDLFSDIPCLPSYPLPHLFFTPCNGQFWFIFQTLLNHPHSARVSSDQKSINDSEC